MKAYSLRRSPQISRDLRAILSFLIRSHVQFSESFGEAKQRASVRVARIEDAIELLAKKPHQGTRREDLLPGLRCVTKDRAILYFTVDDEARLVRVLAIFFGGQDHQRLMLRRLAER